MAAADDACFEPGAGTSSLLGLRIGGLFGTLVASAMGVIVPFLANVEKRGTLFFLLRAFAGGVVLATGEHVCCLAWPGEAAWHPARKLYVCWRNYADAFSCSTVVCS